MTMTPAARVSHLYRLLIRVGTFLQPLLLLGMWLYWGWQLFVTGKGKLLNLDKTAEFFASLNIPLPKLNVLLAGSTECVGGLLLMAGLAARLTTLPLIATMVVAYLTAERESLLALGSDPDKFVTAAPFLFLLTCLVVLAFGPGVISLDWLLGRKLGAARGPVEKVAV